MRLSPHMRVGPPYASLVQSLHGACIHRSMGRSISVNRTLENQTSPAHCKRAMLLTHIRYCQSAEHLRKTIHPAVKISIWTGLVGIPAPLGGLNRNRMPAGRGTFCGVRPTLE